ncbi:conjugal transfer protein [Streptomyces sp. NPDC014646]|uniref:conjugal transfer protein n=1 Tax=Streptomyces sp. NPDC014646 TaxID=3364877 RepID=UPI00370321D5
MKKAPFTRRAKKATAPVDGSDLQDWQIEEGPEDLAGWSTGAQANTSAVIRWTAWGLLILGPLLGAAAYLSTPAQGRPAQAVSAPSAPAAPGAQGAVGFAELFVAAYVSAGEGDQDKLAAYYPDATGLRLEGAPGRRHSEQTTVVRLRQTGPGIWSVTVAARITDTLPSTKPTTSDETADHGTTAVRYFQVPVATAVTDAGASGYTALAMPAEVAAPDRIKAPGLVYGPMRPAAPSDPRTQAVTEFLTAYLTGSDLDRYLSPGTKLTAISPAPYKGIAVDALAIEGETSGEPVTSVPADGTTLRLMAALRATGHDGDRLPLTYALTLKARAGRWEIASLDGAPASTSPAPTTAPSVTP